jgi:heat shock protein HtpX
MITAPIAAVLIQMAVSRSREYAADQTGAGFIHNPTGLASALRKLHESSRKVKFRANPATAHMFIVNPLSARGFANLFSTHPPVEERITRLEALNRGIAI